MFLEPIAYNVPRQVVHEGHERCTALWVQSQVVPQSRPSHIFASPFCPSSVELLVKEGVEFGCFDILADQSVRNDLKKFSEWPTYPQLVRYLYPLALTSHSQHCSPSLNFHGCSLLAVIVAILATRASQEFISAAVREWGACRWPRHHEGVAGKWRSRRRIEIKLNMSPRM